MPRKHKKTRGGNGIVDSLGQTFSNLTSSVSRGVKDAWSKLSNSNQNTSSYQPPIQNNSYQSSQPPQYQPTTNFGGTKTKRRNRHRKNKRGGSFRDNVSLTNLASHAAPFSGNTAQPHNWVGGKTKRSRKSRKHTKRRRH